MRNLLVFIFLLSICLVGSIHLAMGGETIVIGGSTSLLPFTQHAAEVYMERHPEIRISVAGRGSSVGIRGIIDGTADIADMSRDLSKKELKLCAQRGINPITHLVALGCVVPVVDKSNPVSDLSLDQLKDIYTGKINSWRELGGSAGSITVMNRDSNSGTFVMFRLLVLDQARVRPDALMLASNGAMVQAVSGNPLALGYVGLGYLGPELKALSVNGIKVSVANVRNGTFPLSRPLYLVTRGKPEGAAKNFLEFVLGPEGRKIAQMEGLVPAAQ